jgi:uncharacterized membrane-anchored protein
VFAADPPQINWIEGPAKVDLAKVANVQLAQNFIFANAKDTAALMEYLGEPEDSDYAGLITSASNEEWYVLFYYDPIGYVKDAEKEALDSAKILETIKQGTTEANKIRIKNGVSALNILGWYEEPHYDAKTHNLVWAVLGEDADTREPVVNYNTRVLGRYGYMAVNLVSDPESLKTYIGNLDTIVSNFSWNQGKGYAEWVSGDKVAEIGLTALIAGGAGAVAAQTGLLAKIWKFLVAGVLAVGAAIWRFVKRIFGKKDLPESFSS